MIAKVKGNMTNLDASARRSEKKITDSKFFQDVISLIDYTQLKYGELIAEENWGMYNGKPVIIDLGNR